jgi:parvulin-like peptidyl-prolyl isomerase
LQENEIRASSVREKYLLKNLRISLTEIKSYYATHESEFAVKERVRVRHIVTDSEEKAKDMRARLLKGENFAKLAMDHSISPERARGGDLGYFSRGNLPKIFDDTCFNLKKGEISPVVKSEYGYHIFKLIDKKPAGKKEWEEVAAQIQQKLFEEKLKKTYDPWLSTVLKEAKITVYQDVLDKFVL